MYQNIGKTVRLNPVTHKKSEPFLNTDLVIIGIKEMSWMKSFKQWSNLRYICQLPDKSLLYCNPNHIVFA